MCGGHREELMGKHGLCTKQDVRIQFHIIINRCTNPNLIRKHSRKGGPLYRMRNYDRKREQTEFARIFVTIILHTTE